MLDLFVKIEQGNYSVPMTLSKEAISFINCMLQYYTKKRIDIEKLAKHKFLTKNIKEFTYFNLDGEKKKLSILKIILKL